MFDLRATLAVLGFVIGMVFVVWSLRSIGLSKGIGCPGPYWMPLYFAIPITVLPVLLGIYVFGFRENRIFRGISDAQFDTASLWLVYGVVCLCVFLVIFDKWLGQPQFSRRKDSDLVVAPLLIGMILVLVGVIYTQAGFLPVFSLGTVDVGILRKAVTTDATFPSYYGVIVRYVAYFGMAYAGSMSINTRGTKSLKYTLIIVCVFGLLWDAEKAPVIKGLLTFYFAHLWFSGKSVNFVRLAVIVGVGALAIWLLYTWTHPYLGSKAIRDEIIVRLFFGQQAGFYQGYAITEPNPRYLLTWLPLSGWFGVHMASYSRDLMVTLYGNTATNGTLNAFFLQEAWGVLGYIGLVLSPIVVAGSIVLSMKLIVRILRPFGGTRFAVSALFAFLDIDSLNGDFGQFVFGRVLIYTLVIALVVGLLCQIVVQGARVVPSARALVGGTRASRLRAHGAVRPVRWG